jgi:hypothetical protein
VDSKGRVARNKQPSMTKNTAIGSAAPIASQSRRATSIAAAMAIMPARRSRIKSCLRFCVVHNSNIAHQPGRKICSGYPLLPERHASRNSPRAGVNVLTRDGPVSSIKGLRLPQ